MPSGNPCLIWQDERRAEKSDKVACMAAPEGSSLPRRTEPRQGTLRNRAGKTRGKQSQLAQKTKRLYRSRPSMSLPSISQVAGTAVPVLGNDIDTDRIIPARFMKCVTFDDLAEGMFYDVKINPETGEKTNHPLNDSKFDAASIILSGSNFGCGSSREHAPQSIYRSGFRAIIAESFAEIFFGNSTTLGMPCVCANPADIATLADFVTNAPETRITIDLETLKVHYADISFPVTLPDSARSALTSAKYDPLAELLDNEEAIRSTASELAYIS